MDSKRIVIGCLIFITGFIIISCNEDELEGRSYPSLDTKQVSNIDANGAKLNGDLLSIGTNGISDHGFVYDDNEIPTIERSDQISLGSTSSVGEYSAIANRNFVTGRKYKVRAYAISEGNNIIVYGQVVEFTSLGGIIPEILDFYPKQGVAGDTITVEGNGFSDFARNNRIKFGQVFSETLEASGETLLCIVPTFVSMGQSELSISVAEHTSLAQENFELKPIEISSFDPSIVTFEDTVTIVGQNFPGSISFITIEALGEECTILDISSTQIRFVMAADVVISESKISLTVGAQSLNSENDLQLKEPIIEEFTPTQAASGSEINISGYHFSPVASNNNITINGIELTILEASKTKIKARIPSEMTPGTYPISLTRATQSVMSIGNIEIIEP